MAESQKGASSSVNSKEKTSLLDEEIGKEFLTSWKSMSVTEDDAMDFNFETVAKGKKKTFNFEKLDMDFGLDGDFDKISSFKVDMSDLDFSCPPKKTGKPKERSEELTANESHQGKQDRFTFSFDFNELDSFNFDSCLMKGEKKSNEQSDSKGVASDRSECQGSKIHLAEGISALEDSITTELPPSESVTTAKIESLVGGVGDLDSINDIRPSKSATFGNLVVSQGARTSPERAITTSAQETNQESHPSEKTIPTEPYAQQTIQDSSVQSVFGNDSTRDTASELQAEVCSVNTKANTSKDGEQNVNVNRIAGLGSNHENLQLENSPPPHITRSQGNNGERNKLESNNHVPIGNIDGTEPAQDDLDLEDTSITSVSRKMMHGAKSSRENQNSTSKLLSAPFNIGPTVDKLAPMKEKETGGSRLKFFKRSEETESQLHQAPSTQTKIISFGRKRVGTLQLSQADERREGFNANDAQIGRKLVGNSRSHARELTKGGPVFLGSENMKDLNSIGEGFNADGAKNGSKLVGNSSPCDGEVTKGEAVLQGSEKNAKDLNTFGSTEQTTKSSTQKCVNPKLVVPSMASIQNSKIISVEGNKLSPLKAGKRTPDLSSLKISRNLGANNDLSNSTFHKEIKSFRNSDQNMEVQRTTASKMAPSVGTEKQTPLTSSLKRKTFEASNADLLTLKPLKRLSESPRESRNFKVASERIVEEQVCNHENQVESNTKNVFFDRPTSTLDIPREVNMTELEIPLVMENDGNVEKAEAYTKELEEAQGPRGTTCSVSGTSASSTKICNMLKKKHEEAKEILVRAIVNNNNLLMLNHPVYEEKIRMVQKFAARLMSKELRT